MNISFIDFTLRHQTCFIYYSNLTSNSFKQQQWTEVKLTEHPMQFHFAQCLKYLLSHPNNKHNLNNKATKTVVGLSQSNRWEPSSPPPTTTTTHHHHHPPQTQNYMIEQILENKSYQSISGDPKTQPQPQKQTVRAPKSQKWPQN